MKLIQKSMTLSLIGTLMLVGCGSDSSSGGGNSQKDEDIIVATMIDDTTGFINAIKADISHNSTNTNGIEMNPTSDVYTYNGNLFVTESMMGDKIIKYKKEESTFKKVAQLAAGEGSMPTSMIFASATKAYVALSGAGKLLVINPSNMTKTKEIDLSLYALDANGNIDGNDTNPEPSSGIIRNGKLYMGMFQVDSFMTVLCRGKASVVVIDIETDTVLNHTTDNRTCASGRPVQNLGMIIDENQDIYINNIGGYEYYPEINSGILRIKNGEDSFDSNYYFSMTDLRELAVGDGKTSGFYSEHYTQNGMLYTSLSFPSLYSSPIDYVNDKNMQPYVLDLYNQTATKLDLPPSNAWTTGIVPYENKVIFGLSAINGDGLYRYDPATKKADQTPYIRTDGLPLYVINY